MVKRISRTGGRQIRNCGIFGIFSSTLPENRVIKNALDSIRHRGPDDEGYVLINSRTNGCLEGI
jgi:asparagine synthetase B (glutamine-hydrolysing)